MDNVKDFKKGAMKVALQRVDLARELGARGVPMNDGHLTDPTR